MHITSSSLNNYIVLNFIIKNTKVVVYSHKAAISKALELLNNYFALIIFL